MFPQYLSSSNQNCITSVVLESVSSALTFFICDFEKLIKLFSTSIMQLLMQVQFELRISGVTQGSNYLASRVQRIQTIQPLLLLPSQGVQAHERPGQGK